MLHALDLTRSFQTAKTPWQAVNKNDNETIEGIVTKAHHLRFDSARTWTAVRVPFALFIGRRRCQASHQSGSLRR
jgi:hypothetical protein